MIAWKRRGRARLVAFSLGAALLLSLLAPEPAPSQSQGAGARPFVWDADALFAELEARFSRARRAGCGRAAGAIANGMTHLDARIARVRAERPRADDPSLLALQRELFELAPLVAACPRRVDDFVRETVALRREVKLASRDWDIREPGARNTLYRLLYGARAAAEEVILQTDPRRVEPLVAGTDEPSRTPSVTVHGVVLHSGDLLVSRGGAPTSALIARGSDHPGSFSHVALLHVGDDGEAHVVEAHIERGVVVSSVDEYLADKKLRILVLRLAADLPQRSSTIRCFRTPRPRERWTRLARVTCRTTSPWTS